MPKKAPGGFVPRAAGPAVFSLAVFLCAALLFLVQPMAAKRLLPVLGGSPSVWTACMLFFQAALLGGYAWAHAVGAGASGRRLVAHGLVLTIGAAATVASIDRAPIPRAGLHPAAWVPLELAATVGPGFFALASAGPLLQRWYARAGLPRGHDPYFLYAASNAGSLLGLLAYPLLIESSADLPTQARWWAGGFVACAALVAGCGLIARRPGGADAANATGDRAARPSPRAMVAWIGLAFVPSSLMLGATAYISTDIAAFPLLWVVPLAIYLLTFVAAFGVRGTPLRAVGRVSAVLLVATAATILLGARHPVWLIGLLHVLMLGAGGLLCHARLAAQRPGPAGLTTFYLCVSVGGVLGGVFNAVVAPLVFSSIAEYPLALAAVAAAIPAARSRSAWWWIAPAGLAAGLLLLRAAPGVDGSLPGAARSAVVVGVPLVVVYAASAVPRVMAACLGVTLLLAPAPGRAGVAVDHAARSFFGVHRVETVTPRDGQTPPHRRVLHGSTVHGAALLDEPTRPLTYYHEAGPVGDVFAALRAAGGPWRGVGVGLGAGSIASYTRAGDRLVFIEIDPAVIDIASDPEVFRFLADAPGEVSVVEGDGRLRLAEFAPGSLDVLVVDAFSSDAIPAHLLTLEAFDLFLSRLRPSGLLAVHLSNQHLELVPVAAAIAHALKAPAFVRRDDAPGGQDDALRSSSVWVALRRPDAPRPYNPLGWAPLPQPVGVAPWTDARSDVLGVMRWGSPDRP